MQPTKNAQDVNNVFLLAMTEGENLAHDQLEWIWRQAWPIVEKGEVEPGKLAAIVAAAKLIHSDDLDTPEVQARVYEDACRIATKAQATILRMAGCLQ